MIWKPLGFQTLSLVGTAAALTVPAGATRALIQNDNGGPDLRWRDDGTAPTTTAGMLVFSLNGTGFASEPVDYRGDLSAIKLIRSGAAGTAVANVTYFGQA